MTLFSLREEQEELIPPSIPMNNKKNMNQENITTKELVQSLTSIEGGVLKIIRHSAELSRSPKSKT